MKFVDLNVQYKKIQEGILSGISKVLDSGQYILGAEIDKLEEELRQFVDSKHAITISSGTDALLVAMMALGISSGDEVITSPFTFIATAETMALLGAKPVFVDIDPTTYNMDPSKLESVISPKTKAIMPVSLYGQCPDMDAINKIAKKRDLFVIEDGCQSFGATQNGKKSCNLSTIGVTSFFPSKPLGCYGDGGACFTNSDETAKRIKQIRLHGESRRYCHEVIGINGRMDTIQAAVLLEKMKIFPEEINLRQKVANRYSENLNDFVITPRIQNGNTSVFAQYTILVNNRDELSKSLYEKGIPTAIHYPVPLHLQPAFEFLGYAKGSFPVAEETAEKVISLPMHPYLEEGEQDQIIKEIIALKNKKNVQSIYLDLPLR